MPENEIVQSIVSGGAGGVGFGAAILTLVYNLYSQFQKRLDERFDKIDDQFDKLQETVDELKENQDDIKVNTQKTELRVMALESRGKSTAR